MADRPRRARPPDTGAARGIAVGLLAGWAADRLLGDPQRWHPVAGFGTAAAWLEQRVHRDRRAAGAVHLVAAAGPPVLATAWLQHRAARGHPLAMAALTGLLTWVAVGGRQLGEVALRIADAVEAGDLAEARRWLPWLVGRDPDALDADEVVRAVVESVAENTADAVVSPLIWGALAGPAGVVALRLVNTLDAMVGHRSARHARFGTPAARADDVAGLLPSRITALLTASLAPTVGGSAGEAVRAWRHDARRHPSPNAGPVEAAAAGALGVTLGGAVRYGDRVEVRGPLGDGPAPQAADIRRAVRLATRVSAAAAVLAALASAAGRTGIRRRCAGRPGR